ncbi:hypothetical protein BSKO_13991 [Bryopsis sp. KO-2023]|nr:hypothetical protein BSKO_13991 [Bryopsis sp. KO-2023]
MKLRRRNSVARNRRKASLSARGPSLHYTVVQRHVKGEDVLFVLEDLASIHHGRPGLGKWSVYCVCDGHGGTRTAKFVRSQLAPTLSQLLPAGDPPPFDRPDGVRFAEAVRRALVDTFLSLSEAFKLEGSRSAGTTVSVGLVSGWMLTVANVGDSEVFLDQRAKIIEMTCCHKVNDNKREQERLHGAGLKVKALSKSRCGPPKDGEAGIGPLRVWPGGIAMSRSLGDLDCGPHILPVPHVRQAIIPPTGARLVMSSDGLWDHMSGPRACKIVRNCPLAKSAERLLKVACSTSSNGSLTDDTSILVLDILPPGYQDFTELIGGDELQKRMMRSLKGFVQKTIGTKKKRHVGLGGGLNAGGGTGGGSGSSYLFADIDGLTEYPEAMEQSVSNRPSDASAENSSGVKVGTNSQSRDSFSKGSGGSDGWDMCTCSWDCSYETPNIWEIDERDILDTAQNYSGPGSGRERKTGPKITVSLSRDASAKVGSRNDYNDTSFQPLNGGEKLARSPPQCQAE